MQSSAYSSAVNTNSCKNITTNSVPVYFEILVHSNRRSSNRYRNVAKETLPVAEKTQEKKKKIENLNLKHFIVSEKRDFLFFTLISVFSGKKKKKKKKKNPKSSIPNLAGASMKEADKDLR